jgi:hypothetical protein
VGGTHARSTIYVPSWLGQVWVVVTLLALLAMPSASVMAQDTDTVPDAGGKLSRPRQSQIEPGAGEWRTWVLANGAQLRPAAPPEMRATREEIRQLRLLAEQRDAATLDRIAHWTTGAPVYRWHEMFVSEALDRPLNTLLAARALALLHAGMYDATIAAWDAKYTYDRRRPSQVDVRLTTVITNPASPSYPSEHAVVAGAASEILAYLFPNKADFYRNQAVEAARMPFSAPASSIRATSRWGWTWAGRSRHWSSSAA